MQEIYLSFSEIDEPLSLADRGRVSPDSVEQQLPLLALDQSTRQMLQYMLLQREVILYTGVALQGIVHQRLCSYFASVH